MNTALRTVVAIGILLLQGLGLWAVIQTAIWMGGSWSVGAAAFLLAVIGVALWRGYQMPQDDRGRNIDSPCLW